ncbi:MAG: ATP-binding protein [Microcoleus sp. PH2017_10_PVI_O_A]|nr:MULTISPECIES: ATP-binding protein [unclassified Microcoleus]MCC3560231.1 ATP-binding protein [Microcoleus sp. PH2017_27_LUM_O_A]TAE82493.1 MAG: histidine kinase [Oscillatoriales cyanobacterium]MCC3406234.1 ATP-binding protein [Microcoleus sp. PH2017_10_PVI_O_A]MCC3460827.1 ATP-binding protein [Microcoleus sp. PH2017_11_PCY_U_A]MCC3479389.1 ATP-binding protein [Microcoleus sp. PH2017_12_PCY_D_A]
MIYPILTTEVRFEQDIVQVRQRARQIGALLGFDSQTQTRIATAVSEIARNAFKYAGGGKVEFFVEGESPQVFRTRISDSGPGIPDLPTVLGPNFRSQTGAGMGLAAAKRLMDEVQIDSAPDRGTAVQLIKQFSKLMPALSAIELNKLLDKLARQIPEDPYAEIQQQNQELLRTLDELRQRQEELVQLNQELEDTNRGVVALYAELNDKAESLQREGELKTSFLSNMSHEFRTPLTTILSISEILLNRIDGELSPEQDKQVNFIRKSAESLAELVDDSLDLAKVEAGKVTVRVTDFEVEDLFSALRGMMRPLLPQNSPVSLIFEVPLEVPTLTTDEGKVSQILRNLISNALKFTEAGEVRVAAEMGEGGMVTFSVADTGIGIPPADQTRVFEEFVQVENHLQKGVKGTGLGLSLCRKMAEFLGGSIEIESSPGVGSTFLVNLPIAYVGDSEVSAEISGSQPEETGRAMENLRSAGRDRTPKVLIVKEQKSFSVFGERLAGRNSLYCDVRRQRW